jgi:hypothetical protein
MTLALFVASLAHPVGFGLALLALLAVGLAVNPSEPLENTGAFTFGTAAQLLALCGTYYTTFAAGVVAGTIPANVLTGGLDVFLDSAATTPGAQTTRTAAQLWADAVAQFGSFLNDPAIQTNGLQYTLTIKQTGAGTLTLTAGTGVTITGTATVATGTIRQFVVNLTPTVATFTSVAVGTYS